MPWYNSLNPDLLLRTRVHCTCAVFVHRRQWTICVLWYEGSKTVLPGRIQWFPKFSDTHGWFHVFQYWIIWGRLSSSPVDVLLAYRPCRIGSHWFCFLFVVHHFRENRSCQIDNPRHSLPFPDCYVFSTVNNPAVEPHNSALIDEPVLQYKHLWKGLHDSTGIPISHKFSFAIRKLFRTLSFDWVLHCLNFNVKIWYICSAQLR